MNTSLKKNAKLGIVLLVRLTDGCYIWTSQERLGC